MRDSAKARGDDCLIAFADESFTDSEFLYAHFSIKYREDTFGPLFYQIFYIYVFIVAQPCMTAQIYEILHVGGVCIGRDISKKK